MTEPDVPRVHRASGLLMHISSLPSRFGIGDVGPVAMAFLDRLRESGQRYWQILPVGPTGYGNSPYQSASTFAGNPLLISPEVLGEAGLVDEPECVAVMMADGPVEYDAVHRNKLALLFRIAERFPERAGSELRIRLRDFKARHGPVWLDDYCLYTALKEVHDGRAWTGWDEGLARREPAALVTAGERLAGRVEAHRVIQFLFFEQWASLRHDAGRRGVGLVGDLPLYVAHDSADVWANPELFHLDDEGRPTLVGGVPPDYFSATGQRWGSPIFDWKHMAGQGFRWWRDRVRHALGMFDRLRIDHFRGIAGYWAIPAEETTAVNGRWEPGPGESLLQAVWDDVGDLPFIAEDLGVITEDVVALREQFGLPGMRVAQFGFDRVDDSPLHHPDNYPEDVWAYTGTHDNDTTEGWFWQDNPRHRGWRLSRTRRSLYRSAQRDIPWGLVEMVGHSRASTAVFPVQDILGLGSEARMNVPGTKSGNWEWRLRPGELTDDSLLRLRSLTEESRRIDRS